MPKMSGGKRNWLIKMSLKDLARNFRVLQGSNKKKMICSKETWCDFRGSSRISSVGGDSGQQPSESICLEIHLQVKCTGFLRLHVYLEWIVLD
jgi:hypothetical protein